MALGREIEILISLGKAGHDLVGSGAVMEIGAQQLSNYFLESRDALAELAALLSVEAPCPLPAPSTARVLLHGGQEHLDEAAPQAAAFWEWLGYRYASIDIDGSPGSIALDLNYDDLPESEKGQYQIVTNCGTTEHVANQLNAFKIIHELAAPGGIMIHTLPAQGFFNHGLINYNPKFFWMLARSNFYEVLGMDFIFGSPYSLPDNVMEELIRHNPNILNRTFSRPSDYRSADSGLVFVFKKPQDTPYVAPLDVATGTVTDNKQLQERYWSVLKPLASSGSEAS